LEHYGRTVIVRLNRPEVLNALNSEAMHEMVAQLSALDRDPEVGCFVITGKEFNGGNVSGGGNP
jgi:enoyl-CoA hydratase